MILTFQTYIWDLRQSEKPLKCMTNNVKTVNTVKVFEGQDRFMTGSIDSQLKIYELSNVRNQKVSFKNYSKSNKCSNFCLVKAYPHT